MWRNTYQRLPVVISGGWYPYFCNVYIFMSMDYFCKERGEKKLNYFLKGRKKKKKRNMPAEIYSLPLGERFQCNSTVSASQILAIGARVVFSQNEPKCLCSQRETEPHCVSLLPSSFWPCGGHGSCSSTLVDGVKPAGFPCPSLASQAAHFRRL